MNHYKINKRTLAIVPISKSKSKIYEYNNVIVIKKNTEQVIKENCEYYGSSYEGRKKGTTELIGVTHKSPIIIEDTHHIIFFPTSSPRLKTCSWISLNNLESYESYENKSILKFQNELSIQLPVSNKIIDNQVLRATRLDSVSRHRKKVLNDDKTNKKNTKKV